MSAKLKKQPDIDLTEAGEDCNVNGSNLISRRDTIEKRTQERTKTHACDCISRQAAIDALDQIFDRCEEIEAHLPEGDPDRTGYKMYPDYMTVWKYLHQLPSAQPDVPDMNVGKWISCSERLPEDGTEVFVYLFERKDPYIAWVEDCRWYTEDFEVEKEYYPIAWMPLPEPYREEQT